MIAGNALNGGLPLGIVEVTTLLVVRLGSNMFTSSIPSDYFQLSQLRV